MKKLLFVALLMIALVFTVVACQGNKNPDDTTAGDTTVASDVTKAPEESTKAPDDATKAPEETTEVPDETTQAPAVTTEEPPVTTEEPPVETEEPETTEALPETDDPAEPVHVIDPEAIHSNATSSGGLTFVQEVGSAEIITEGGRTFVRLTVDQNGGGDPYVTVINIGSNLTLPNYMAISYRTNSTMDGQFFMGSGVGWSGQGDSFNASWNEDDAWNLLIVDLSATGMTSITDGLINYARMDFFAGKGAEGDHFDVEYIAFFNSAEYAHAYDFEMHKAPMWDEEKNVVTHLSFDELYKGSDSKNNFFTPGQSGSWDKVATLNDFSVSYLTYWGWVGVKGEIGQFGYQINGGSAIFDDAWTYSNPAENLLPHCPAGTDNATRMKIAISLDGLEGTNSVRTLYKSADGSVVCLTEFTVVLPEAPKDITDTFTSDISSQDVGTALGSTDLKNFFTMNLPLPGSGVEAFGDGKIYNMTSINEMYAQMDGLYYIKTNNVESNSSGWMFVRGYAVVNADSLIEAHNPDAGIYKINNFYETDGNGYMGGAGIYARIENGVLHIMVKYYDSEKLSRVNNKFYSIACTGTELAMADNGSVVSILVDGKTMATIAISGSITYDDMKEGNVLPYNTFASTVVVKLADGTVETIENTLVADTYDCQVGVVARSGVFKFESIEVGKLSDIHIPDMKPDEPADVRTDKTEYVVGEDILVTATGSANDWVGLYLEGDIAASTADGGVASIYWYYVAADGNTSGTAVNIRTTKTNAGRSDYFDIPAGQYKLILFKDDTYEVLAEIHFTVKAAETEEPSDENAIKVTTTDNDAWVDEYTFTAEAAGTYTFTLPAGLGMYSLKAWDAWGDAELDYNMNPNGGDVKVTLKAGEEYKFYVGATTKADWVITYTFTEGEAGGDDDEPTEVPALSIGANTITVTDADLEIGAIAYTFTVTEAGTYTFASNDLMAQIYDADGNMISRGQSYLGAGDYIIMVIVSAAGNYSITVEYEAPAEENVIKVTTTDTYDWNDPDCYTFTAAAAGTYVFSIPAGLGFSSYDGWYNWEDPEVDFNDNTDGATVTVTLAAGAEYKFCIAAATKADWVITYTFTAGEVGGGDEGGEGGDEPATPTELAIGVNTIPVTAADLDAGAIAYTFTVTDAGMYTFKSNDLMAQIYDADGNMMARGMSYLKPGVYTIQVVVAYVSAPGNYSITVEYEAVDENGYKTETAYKFYTVQGKLESTPTLYLDGGVDGRYLTTTTDITKAIDVYLEAAEGGYKIYTLVDGAKQYVEVYLNDSSRVSVRYNADANCVFTYNAETYAWETTLDGVDYYLGTYNTFDTISASKTSYINAENTRVSQFPLELVLSE